MIEAVKSGEVWRLLTYAFLHDPFSPLHIIFNMLFLWWFGSDVEDIFLHNALRTLTPHLPAERAPKPALGPELWQHARSVISGGTGLLSKRAEMFGSPRPYRIRSPRSTPLRMSRFIA